MQSTKASPAIDTPWPFTGSSTFLWILLFTASGLPMDHQDAGASVLSGVMGISAAWLTQIAVSAGLVVAGLYNLSIFAMRTKERTALYFGLFSLCDGINTLIFGMGGSLHEQLPHLPELALRKLDIITVMLSIFFFVLFIRSYFSLQRDRVSRAIAGISGVSAVVALLISGPPLELLFKAFFAVIVVMIFWSIHIGVRAVRKGFPDARWFLAGIFLLSAAGLNDVCWGLGLYRTMITVPLAALVFSLMHSVLISKRFAQAFAASERLNAELVKNQRLREELEQRIRREQALRNEQRRLSRLLHAIDVPLCVVDEDDLVEFCNQAFEIMTGKDLKELAGKPLSASMDPLLLRSETGCVTLDLDDEQLKVHLFSAAGYDAAKHRSLVAFIDEINKNRERVLSLERLISARDPEYIRKHPELAREFEAIDQALRCLGAGLFDTPDMQEQRAVACELMNKLVEYWCSCTGKSKYELAQESGLWKVYINPDGWERTQTLDRYLDLKRFPRNPRWNRVFKTADFVLLRCTTPSSLRTEIEADMSRLMAITGNG